MVKSILVKSSVEAAKKLKLRQVVNGLIVSAIYAGEIQTDENGQEFVWVSLETPNTLGVRRTTKRAPWYAKELKTGRKELAKQSIEREAYVKSVR